MAESIEAAWVAAIDAVWDVMEKPATAEDAVRALALAVLESVEMYIIDDAVVEAARARIGRLGK